MAELLLMFYSNVLPVFTHFNPFLQRDDPCIHLLEEQCNRFMQEVLSKFVKVSVIKEAQTFSDVDFAKEENQRSNRDLAIGLS